MRVTSRLILSVVLLLGVCGVPVAADPIILTYTSPAAFASAYPGMVMLGLEEFNDITLDGNVVVNPAGAFLNGGGGLPESYETLGVTTFSLQSGGPAQLFGIGYFPEPGTPPTPFVRLYSGGQWYDAGQLLGVLEDPTGSSSSHFWAFYSSYPFTAVEVNPGTGQKFNADAVGFGALPVPEPGSTLALLTMGVLAMARGLARRGSR